MTSLETIESLRRMLDNSLSVEELSDMPLGFFLKGIGTYSTPRGPPVHKVEVVISVLSDAVLGPQPARGEQPFGDATNRPYNHRLSCGSTMEAMPPPPAPGNLHRPPPSKSVLGVKEGAPTQVPSAAPSRSSGRASFGRLCPSTAAAALRPGSNGEYGPGAGMDWKTLDKGGSILYQTQAGILEKGGAPRRG